MVILIVSYDTGMHQDTLLNKTRFKVFIKLSVFRWMVRIVRETTTLNNKEISDSDSIMREIGLLFQSKWGNMGKMFKLF